MNHDHDQLLVMLSIVIAIFASYTALDLASSITGSKGRARQAWLWGGAIAMGVGIWSMHFIAMLAFSLPGIQIAYDAPLLVLSVLVAIAASAIALTIVSRERVSLSAYVVGSLSMGAAISGMHYIGIASMRMAAVIEWDWSLVRASIAIAVTASYVALWLAFRFRSDLTRRGFWLRGAGSVVMGFAIAGMHYTAMAAMAVFPAETAPLREEQLLATDGLAMTVVGTTLLILGIAVAGSIIERALSRRTAMTEQVTSILESITDAFFGVDRDWRFTYVNRVAHETIRRLVKADPDRLLGRSLWEAVPDLLGTRFEQEYRNSMDRGTDASFEEFFKPFGIWLETRIYPSRDGLSVYFRDVTDRKLSEQALQQAIRARDEFLSIASHELRTPLTSMKMQTQVMKRSMAKGDAGALSPERTVKLIDQFDRQVDRIVRLVEDMLDISRISTGKLAITREPVDFCALLREQAERHSLLFEAAKCRLTVECGETVVGNWDRFRIEQVISNLLTNAIRYGRGNPVEIVGGRSGDVAVLRVSDQGIGIPKESQERIFQRFERAVPAGEISGLGLGLYIVRSILEMHGGTIAVESEPGKGSTFTVRLPLRA